MRRLGRRAGGAEPGANLALEFRPASSNGLARNSKLAKDHELIAPTHKRMEKELRVVKLKHPKIRFTNLVATRALHKPKVDKIEAEERNMRQQMTERGGQGGTKYELFLYTQDVPCMACFIHQTKYKRSKRPDIDRFNGSCPASSY